MPPSKQTDGGYGWIVVLCDFFMFLVYGVHYVMFSVFLLDFARYFERSQAELGLLQSIEGGLTCFSAIPAALLTQRYGCRPVIICGILLLTLGTVLCVFLESFIWFLASNSVLRGFAQGMVRAPAYVIVQQHFNKRRSIAAGISSSGFCFGCLCGGPACSLLIQYLGWRSALMAIAAITLQMLVAASLLRPPLKVRQRLLSGNPESPTKHVNEGSSPFMSTPSNPDSGSGEPGGEDNELDWVIAATSKCRCGVMGEKSCNHAEPSIGKSCKGHTTTSHSTVNTTTIYRDPRLWLLSWCKFLSIFGVTAVYLLCVPSAVLHGVDELQASFAITAVAIGSIFAMVVSGIIANNRFVNRLLMFAVGLFLGAVIVILLAFVPNNLVGLFTLAAVYGLTYGTQDGLTPTIAVDLFGVSSLPHAVSVYSAMMGLASFIVMPLAGWLFDLTDDYIASFTVLGLIQIVGGVVAFILYGLTRRKSPKNSQTN